MGKRVTETKPCDVLRDWLKANEKNQEWLADQLGTHQTSVSAWFNQKKPRRVPLDKAIMIAKLTGIAIEVLAGVAPKKVARSKPASRSRAA